MIYDFFYEYYKDIMHISQYDCGSIYRPIYLFQKLHIFL